MNLLLNLWQPDLVTIAASIIAGVVGLAGVLMSVNVFRHEGKAGTISPKKRIHALTLVGLAIAAGAVGILLAHVGAVWFSVHALAVLAVASLSLYERNNTKDLMWRFGVRVVFGAFLVASGLVIMQFNPLQFVPSTVAAQVAFILVFLGYGVSLGIAPMHAGLSELYSKIPSPIAACVAPLSLLVGVLGLFRMRAAVDVLLADNGVWTGTIFLVFGFITAFVLACTLLRQENYKKFFAELSMVHTGMLMTFAGFGVAGTIPSLMHLGLTAVLTSALFCIAGILHATYKTTKCSGVRNMFVVLPIPSVLFVIMLVGAVGTPVSGMFMSFMIGTGYGLQFHPLLTIGLVGTWILMLTSVVARLFSLMRTHHDGAVALLPVHWKMSLAVIVSECVMLLVATWWIGTQHGVKFFVDVAQRISPF